MERGERLFGKTRGEKRDGKMGGWEDGRGNGRRNKSKCPMRIDIDPPPAV